MKLLKAYLPVELWVFIRDLADSQETTMSRVVVNALLELPGAPECPKYTKVYKDKELTPTGKTMAKLRNQRIQHIAKLLKYAPGELWSRKELAREANCSIKSISRYIPELVARYPIRIVRKGRGSKIYLRWEEV